MTQCHNEDKTMKATIAIAAILITVIGTPAFARNGVNSTTLLGKIVAGHGMPGDMARSKSDPDVTFRVLDNGKVERTNSRLGTVFITNPRAEWSRTSLSR
jgi:hypothetical protein